MPQAKVPSQQKLKRAQACAHRQVGPAADPLGGHEVDAPPNLLSEEFGVSLNLIGSDGECKRLQTAHCAVYFGSDRYSR